MIAMRFISLPLFQLKRRSEEQLFCFEHCEKGVSSCALAQRTCLARTNKIVSVDFAVDGSRTVVSSGSTTRLSQEGGKQSAR
jgi:hypothetical protein